MQNNYTIRDLLDAGLHLGHKIKKWNPKMEPFIYGSKNSIHIIDLRKTYDLLENALEFIKKVVSNDGKILFVGTKLQANNIVKKYALECNQFYVNKRWLGGMLTNWSTISNSINHLNNLNEKLSKKDLGLKKKEILKMNRQINKIENSLGGLKEMGNLPEAIFVVDVNKDSISVFEANKLKIPVIAILDTNSSPDGVDYPIPGNDDSRKSIDLICSLISKQVKKYFKTNNIKKKNEKDLIQTKIPSKDIVKKEIDSKKNKNTLKKSTKIKKSKKLKK